MYGNFKIFIFVFSFYLFTSCLFFLDLGELTFDFFPITIDPFPSLSLRPFKTVQIIIISFFLFIYSLHIMYYTLTHLIITFFLYSCMEILIFIQFSSDLYENKKLSVTLCIIVSLAFVNLAFSILIVLQEKISYYLTASCRFVALNLWIKTNFTIVVFLPIKPKATG